jgi:hypothetical protein
VVKLCPPNQLLLLIASPHSYEYRKTVLQAGWPHSPLGSASISPPFQRIYFAGFALTSRGTLDTMARLAKLEGDDDR